MTSEIQLLKLQDLNKLIKRCREHYQNLAYKADVRFSHHFAKLITESLNKDIKDTVIPHAFSIELINDKKLLAFISSSCFWIAESFWPLNSALDDYKKVLDYVKKIYTKEYTNKNLDTLLRKLPLEKEDSLEITNDEKDRWNTAIDIAIADSENNAFFKRFCFDKTWIFLEEDSEEGKKAEGKKLNRGDFNQSCVMLATKMVIASSSKLFNIIKCFSNSLEIREAFAELSNEEEDFREVSSPVKTIRQNNQKGINKIFYGAPGTGKSHAIDQLIDTNHSIKTVFHPETQYSDFVGCLKPSMQNNEICYSFIPGPFTEVIIKALKNPEEHYYLIIEELNRAPAAAVFGDIFQLLDRDENGQSLYNINIADENWLKYLTDNLKTQLKNNRLFIPSNLSIFATMNSSDQAVMPLDTAFKRRWYFEYKKLDFNTCALGDIPITIDEKNQEITWSIFAQTINLILSKNSIPEDRLLGPWFVNHEEISDIVHAKNTLSGKVFMYLWDDVLRHGNRQLIFDDKITTYGNLIDKFEKDENIFSTNFIEELNKLINEENILIE